MDRQRRPNSPAPTTPFWSVDEADLLERLGATPHGLTNAEADRRRAEVGPNRLGADRHASDRVLLFRQISDPVMLLLVIAAVLSVFLGDRIDATIILVIVAMSATLGFLQERGAVHALRALAGGVRVHADVRRDGAEREVWLDDVVPGDVVVLRAGDVVPADARVLSADQLLVDESALTGEPYPVHKQPTVSPADAAPTARRGAVFMGTHVASGRAEVVVAATGVATELGRIGRGLAAAEPPTTFERGARQFGYLLMRVGAAIVVLVLGTNLVLDRPVLDSVLFSLALAIGITPQMLPAIVTLTLSRGIRRLAARKVLVKRLSSIEDIGSIDTLCVDKTGTLTVGTVALDAVVDLGGAPSAEVARLAWLNAHHQQGFANPVDTTVLAAVPDPADVGVCRGEVPFDFTRKRVTVAVSTDVGTHLITKGAVATVLQICSTARLPDGRVVALDEVAAEVGERASQLASAGARVLGVAVREVSSTPTALSADDEHDMCLVGLLVLGDRLKPGITDTIDGLAAVGIAVRLITGDSRTGARQVAAAVGLDTSVILTGAEIDAVDDTELTRLAADCHVFAEVEPMHKARIVDALQAAGRSVGFLGDGINDALALRSADVGISVDTAVDVAKESAAMVLLDKDLNVLLEGIRLGRRIFANTLKYVFVTTSANFGNMVSMAGATLLLPFLPLLPRQVLLLNFLSDIPGMTIAGDGVDDELLAGPTRWDIRLVRRFMVVFGLVSSLFDYAAFAILYLVLDVGADLFRTGWFVLSVGTELLVMLMLRTRRPFVRSRPGRALVGTSVLVGAVAFALPWTGLGEELGLVAPSAGVMVAVVALLGSYVMVTELAKRIFYRSRLVRS
ncbi:MAG: magnesium-translocating P-type ATPase [Ilumatobacteraceae bacterium]